MDKPMTIAPLPTATAIFDVTRYGLESRYYDTPVGPVRMFEGGSGPALLLLHGIGGGASSYYWARVAPLLARRYRVTTFDFVGWGDSDHPAVSYSSMIMSPRFVRCSV